MKYLGINMNIDELRRKMVADGVPSEFAGIATGLAADYANDIHINAFNRGYNLGHVDGMERGTGLRNSILRDLRQHECTQPS